MGGEKFVIQAFIQLKFVCLASDTMCSGYQILRGLMSLHS